jgi:hypothetical protein
MKKYYQIKEKEKCIDGTSIFEIILDFSMDKDFFNKININNGGKLYEKFARPFFRIKYETGSIMKGVIGHNRITIIIPTSIMEEEIRYIKNLLDSY